MHRRHHNVSVFFERSGALLSNICAFRIGQLCCIAIATAVLAVLVHLLQVRDPLPHPFMLACFRVAREELLYIRSDPLPLRRQYEKILRCNRTMNAQLTTRPSA